MHNQGALTVYSITSIPQTIDQIILISSAVDKGFLYNPWIDHSNAV
jgi:hypothetical protein